MDYFLSLRANLSLFVDVTAKSTNDEGVCEAMSRRRLCIQINIWNDGFDVLVPATFRSGMKLVEAVQILFTIKCGGGLIGAAEEIQRMSVAESLFDASWKKEKGGVGKKGLYDYAD